MASWWSNHCEERTNSRVVAVVSIHDATDKVQRFFCLSVLDIFRYSKHTPLEPLDSNIMQKC